MLWTISMDKNDCKVLLKKYWYELAKFFLILRIIRFKIYKIKKNEIMLNCLKKKKVSWKWSHRIELTKQVTSLLRRKEKRQQNFLWG